MRAFSRWALASLASLPVAGLFCLLGRLEGNRMVAAGQGFDTAFYWSPPVFWAVDGVLMLGGMTGLAGVVAGPKRTQRVQAAMAALVCVGTSYALPWHRVYCCSRSLPTPMTARQVDPGRA